MIVRSSIQDVIMENKFVSVVLVWFDVIQFVLTEIVLLLNMLVSVYYVF